MSTHPQSTIFDLGRQLLRLGGRALLDRPLDALESDIEDADVRDLLRQAWELGEVDSLRDLLQDGRFDRWIAESCTEREEQAVCRQLLRWLGGQRGGALTFGDDDPARLVSLPPLPDSRDALVLWAERHGGLRALLAPVRDHLPDLQFGHSGASLLDCCMAEGPGAGAGQSLLGSEQPRVRGRETLRLLAVQDSSVEARQDLWERPVPPGQPGMLAARLRALLEGHDPEVLVRQRFLPARPVTLEPETGIAGAAIRASGEDVAEPRLLLSGYEHGPVAAECGSCARSDCGHVAALAARLLDALHDPEDRLAEALGRFLDEPSWRRFLRGVRPPEPTEVVSERGRLRFRLRASGAGFEITVCLQKPRSGGGFTVGKTVSPHKHLHGPATREPDRAVLQAMGNASRSMSAGYLPVDVGILRALVEHPGVELEGGAEPLRVVEEHVEVELRELPGGMRPLARLAGAPLPNRLPGQAQGYVARHERATRALVFAPLNPALRRMVESIGQFRGLLPPESYSSLAPWLAGIRHVARVEVPRALQGSERPAPARLLLRISAAPGDEMRCTLTSRALPLAPLWPPGQGPELVHGLQDGEPVFARRDLAQESVLAQEVLEKSGLSEQVRIDEFDRLVPGEQEMLAVLGQLAQLSSRVEIEWAEDTRRRSLVTPVRRTDLKVDLFKQGQWLQLRGGACHAGQDLALARLLDAARRGERYVKVGGDSYAEIERGLFEQLQRLHGCVISEGDAARMACAAAPLWMSTLADRGVVDDVETADWLSRVENVEREEVSIPASWDGRLRDYQRVGVQWLAGLARWASGACLADEMGLGKTIQAIVLLELRAALGPALVVAPTSVVPNWLEELARFAPGLDAAPLPGRSGAEMCHALGPGQVRVVSYERLLREREALRDIPLATLVVDEAQMVKNARTQRARALLELQASFVLALSGTPIENRLGDLWSLFRLVAPGLLGSWERFRAVFAVPIERHADPERGAHLRQLIAPFVLRRTKDQVARELPPRTEVLHRVELSTAEQDLYDAAVRQVQREMERVRTAGGAERSVRILAELTRLRQLACHPRLVVEDAGLESSKLVALRNLLGDILPRGHRVLIFSQFTRHLALVRESLEAEGRDYLYLDGGTPAGERGELVASFQQGAAQIFLISLKAGGTGLNLTAADYVVHLDPWWNPAAEAQASDRAHRIGQQRPVTVVKLIAQQTIEEKVLALHAHKRALASDLLAGRSRPENLDMATLEGLLVGPPS